MGKLISVDLKTLISDAFARFKPTYPHQFPDVLFKYVPAPSSNRKPGVAVFKRFEQKTGIRIGNQSKLRCSLRNLFRGSYKPSIPSRFFQLSLQVSPGSLH